MRSFDGSNVVIDFENVIDRSFDFFDEVIFIDEKINKIFEIKSSEKFDVIYESDNASYILEKLKASIYPDDKKVLEAFNPFTNKIFTDEIRIKNDTEEYRWCHLKFIPVNGYSYFAMFLDVTHNIDDFSKIKNQYLQKQIASDYQISLLKQKYMAVIDHIKILAFEMNLKTGMVSINSNLQNKFQFISNYYDSIDNLKKSDLIHEKDKAIFDTLKERLESRKYTSANVRMKNDDGKYFDCLMHIYGVYDNGGVLCSIVGSAVDVNDAEKTQKENEDFDEKTGLLKPESFCLKAEYMLKNSEDEKFALILFDIEQFKSINEFYGISFADKVIEFVGFNLKNMFSSKNALTVKFLSDYYGVFTAYSDKEELYDFINKFNSTITYYRDVKIKYAYGIYEIEDKLMPLRFICDYANMARKSIKGNHLNRIAFYSEEMKSKMIEEINIENEMETSLAQRQFSMYLQPKYNIRTSKIVGAEALVRWEHPIKGLIAPYKFIPLFERNGFIMQLDMFIWEEACCALRRWIDAGLDPIPISVNVSRINVSNPNLVEYIDELVEKYKIEKKYLELEITETIYYEDQAKLREALLKLKKSGYTLLMDDFGSGFSSLSMLENTPFDVLKIDRSFFNDTTITDKGKKIIRHTICLSNDIGLNIVAEGVETKEQADYLLQCGCCVAQGYYYSKPIPLETFEKLIGYKK